MVPFCWSSGRKRRDLIKMPFLERKEKNQRRVQSWTDESVAHLNFEWKDEGMEWRNLWIPVKSPLLSLFSPFARRFEFRHENHLSNGFLSHLHHIIRCSCSPPHPFTLFPLSSSSGLCSVSEFLDTETCKNQRMTSSMSEVGLDQEHAFICWTTSEVRRPSS